MPVPSRRRTPARGRIISGRRIYFCATPVETFARWPCLRPDAAELQHDGELFLGAENNSARLQSRLLRFGHAFGQPPPDASTRRNFLGAQNHSARKIVYVGPFRLVQWREDMAKCMFLVAWPVPKARNHCRKSVLAGGPFPKSRKHVE